MKMMQHQMTYQQARTEGERCLQCHEAPCITACPAHIDIPKFIMMIKSGNVTGASEVVRTSNALACVCGTVCPQEIYCQSVCNRGKIDVPVEIRELHSFASQYEAEKGFRGHRDFPALKKKVAVVGGGPAGLGCAFELAKFGYSVDLFDKSGFGGVPKNSIPGFRLPDEILKQDLKFLSRHFSLKKELVDDLKLEKLKENYGAVFLAVGLGNDRQLGIKGEYLPGVLPVLQFLEKAKTGPLDTLTGKQVMVVGGGNVSLDAAATAKRLGASGVVLIYRRSEHEMRVWKSELVEARAQGVEIRFLTNPVQITGNRQVEGLIAVRMRLSRKKDSTGRYIPEEIEGTSHFVPADIVIIAIGQHMKSSLFTSLQRSKRDFIEVDDKFQTSVPGVFAGGDSISGEGTIVLSVSHGKHAAHSIHEYLSSR